ncbi:MAG: efflux RND transporter permease subunit [Deltaproteobacteria bacterium]|nr:efflux RND transporter permease subunit [Deltaproteobacteria bacterium]
MKSIVNWFTINHVAANLLMMFFLLAGTVTAFTMKIEVFPETAPDKISVTVEYPGASPEEVEEAIVRRIEEKIAGLTGIKRIDSIAREGFATTTIEVIEGWDLKKLLDEVKSEVDRITTFPEEAEKPVIREITRTTEVISVAVYGDVPEQTIKRLSEKIKDDITNLPDITYAELFGARTGEIHIEIPEKTLRRYNLTLGMVAELVRKASMDLPAGNIKSAGGEILVRTKGRRYHANEYRDIAIITSRDGSKVTLGDIATLRDGYEDVDLFTRFQGKPAAVIQVFRVGNQNALAVASAVKEYIKTIRPGLPAGVDIAFYQDMSKILKSRIRLLLKNMAWGLLLVAILLGIFMDVRLAFWVTLGIPISFLAALWALPYFDISINMVSLFAFIMVLGIVVDDAIVIGENIFRKRETGAGSLRAAVEGAVEVGRPVIFSVLTTVVAFWPLLLGTGTMGKIMRNLPIVVILVLLASLTESLLILPCHLSRSKGGQNGEKRMSRWLRRLVNGPYKRLLDFCLRWRYATVALGIAMLLLTAGVWRGGWLKFTFFPRVESDVLTCSLTMPVGTPVGRTVQMVSRIEQAAKESLQNLEKDRPKGAPSLFEYSVSLVGMQISGHGPGGGKAEVGGHLAQVFVQLLEGEKRDVSATRLANVWRKKVGTIPDAESISFQSELFSAGTPVEVHLSLDNHSQLIAAANDLKAELKQYPGVFDINDSYVPGKTEMQIKLKPAARSLGVTLNDLARQVRNALYGAEALRLQRDRDEVKVLVRYPESERRAIGSVEDMRIHAPDGSEIPFGEVAQVRMARGYASIQRAQRRRVIKVTADVDEKVANANEIRMDLERNFLPRLKQEYPGLRYTMEGAGKNQKESMTDVLDGFIIALFCIYTLLAIPFKSFTQPFIVMLAIPFGLVGAVAGHLLMGFNLSFISLFGMVGLAGVVVNDSLVLIDATNRLRKEGATPHQAIVNAGGLRFRAIILTSLTTFAGLTPMLLEKSLQARFLIPMAISLGFGILFATGITLLLIPCGYLMLEDLHRLAEKMKPRRTEK